MEASVPREISRKLEQFGYNLFQTSASTFAPVDNAPVGSDYVLGPGDALTLYVYGLVESVLNETIDRNGEIFLPKVGPVRVWGLSFAQAEELLNQRLARVFSNFKTSMTMGRLRTIKVFVVGDVVQPGGYTMSALSTISNALYFAGGPSKLGTLRDIRLLRNNKQVVSFDLYDFLLRGDKSHDVRLEAGDTIFVPPIGRVVGLAGYVKRPAIYELKDGMRLSEALKMAGGITPFAYLRSVQLERVRTDKEKYVLDINLSRLLDDGDQSVDIPVKDGDMIKVFPIDMRTYNTVQLEGFVKHPREYELKPGMRVADLLTQQEVLPAAYLNRVEVVRTNEQLRQEVHVVDAKRLWEGDESQNLPLLPLDRIIVKSELKPLESVKLEGEVRRPGTYSVQKGERLSSVIARAGGYTDEAYLKGAIFTRESVRKVQQQKLEEFVKTQEARLLADSASIEATGVTSDEARAEKENLNQRREMLRLAASQVVPGRVALKLDAPEKMKGGPFDIELENGDTVAVPRTPAAVLVIGSVRNPTAVTWQQGREVDYYLNQSGGLTKDADKSEIYIVKPDGTAVASFVRVRDVDPGDVVMVPASTDTKVRWRPLIRDIAQIFGSFALGIAGLHTITK